MASSGETAEPIRVIVLPKILWLLRSDALRLHNGRPASSFVRPFEADPVSLICFVWSSAIRSPAFAGC